MRAKSHSVVWKHPVVQHPDQLMECVLVNAQPCCAMDTFVWLFCTQAWFANLVREVGVLFGWHVMVILSEDSYWHNISWWTIPWTHDISIAGFICT